MYICIHTPVYTYKHKYIYIYIYPYLYIKSFIYTYIYVYICTYIYTCMYTYQMYTCLKHLCPINSTFCKGTVMSRVDINIHMYVYICIYIYTYIYVLRTSKNQSKKYLDLRHSNRRKARVFKGSHACILAHPCGACGA